MRLDRSNKLDDERRVTHLKDQQFNQSVVGFIQLGWAQWALKCGKKIRVHSSDLVEGISMKTTTFTVTSIAISYDFFNLWCSQKRIFKLQSSLGPKNAELQNNAEMQNRSRKARN